MNAPILYQLTDEQVAAARQSCLRRIAQYPYNCKFARQMLARLTAELERRQWDAP